MSTLLIDSCDSVLTMNVVVKCVDEAIAERAADMWVHFYDAVPLTVGVGKSYDVKFVADGVNLGASFRIHVDTFADVFGEDVLEHLEEVAYICEDDTFYVQAPCAGGGYEPILTHYITVGKTKAFVCCFGGEELVGTTPKEEVKAKTPFQLSTPYQPQEEDSTAAKAKERANELGKMAYQLGEEVRQLKEEVAALQAQIAEKEAQIQLYEYAQEELEAVAEE